MRIFGLVLTMWLLSGFGFGDLSAAILQTTHMSKADYEKLVQVGPKNFRSSYVPFKPVRDGAPTPIHKPKAVEASVVSQTQGDVVAARSASLPRVKRMIQRGILKRGKESKARFQERFDALTGRAKTVRQSVVTAAYPPDRAPQFSEIVEQFKRN